MDVFLHPGWGSFSSVAALSSFSLLRIQWIFWNIYPSQESCKEDPSGDSRWGVITYLLVYICILCLHSLCLQVLFIIFNLTSMHFSKTSSTRQKANSDWPKVLHPAQTADYSCATCSSSCSSFAGQNDHPPAPADHCASCGQTCSGHYPTCRSEFTLRHVRLAAFHHSFLHIRLESLAVWLFTEIFYHFILN